MSTDNNSVKISLINKLTEIVITKEKAEKFFNDWCQYKDLSVASNTKPLDEDFMQILMNYGLTKDSALQILGWCLKINFPNENWYLITWESPFNCLEFCKESDLESIDETKTESSN